MPGLFQFERTWFDFYQRAEHLGAQRAPDDFLPSLDGYAVNAVLSATCDWLALLNFLLQQD